MGDFAQDPSLIEVDEHGQIVGDPEGVKLTKEQRDIMQARLGAARIFNETGDDTLARMIGLFP